MVQGFTEFLPISSSGHLVLFGHLLGLEEPDLFFDVILHLGTLTAVAILFWRDIRDMIVAFFRGIAQPARLAETYRNNESFRMAMLIVVGTIPAGLAGVLLKDRIEALFGSLTAVGFAFLVTGAILISTRIFRSDADKSILQIGIPAVLFIGLGQALALTPGISRSGTTIAFALLLGVNRELAGRFSFLLAIPAILGATILQLDSPETAQSGYIPALLTGFAVSVVVGVVALRVLMGLVKQGKFFYFAFYIVPVGLLTLILSRMN